MYRKLNLKKGDIIQEEHLAHIEQGIADATPMVNVTYAELVALRNEGKLIAGQKYRMTDYETTCAWANTQVAGHPFDLVLTALDNNTLDEKCSAIQSARDKDGYFANSNLAAWDVRYCLDNDTERFDWASQKGKYLVADSDGYQYIGKLNGTYTLEGVTYKKWDVNDYGYLMYLLTLSENPNEGEEIIACDPQDGDNNWTVIAVKVEDRTDGKGVIYRLTDESENSVPYDFKNIMFKRPLTEGKYDAENGVDTFCYTFSCIDVQFLSVSDYSLYSFCSDNVIHDGYDVVFLNINGDLCQANVFTTCFYCTFGSGAYCNRGSIDNSEIDSYASNNIFNASYIIIQGKYINDNFISCYDTTICNYETASFTNAIRHLHVQGEAIGNVEVPRGSRIPVYITSIYANQILYTAEDIINK